MRSDVTGIIPASSSGRWSPACAAVESVLSQTIMPREIIVPIDRDPELLQRLAHRWKQRRRRPPSSDQDRSRESPSEGIRS
jgi:hypothetical protein